MLQKLGTANLPSAINSLLLIESSVKTRLNLVKTTALHNDAVTVVNNHAPINRYLKTNIRESSPPDHIKVTGIIKSLERASLCDGPLTGFETQYYHSQRIVIICLNIFSIEISNFSRSFRLPKSNLFGSVLKKLFLQCGGQVWLSR